MKAGFSRDLGPGVEGALGQGDGDSGWVGHGPDSLVGSQTTHSFHTQKVVNEVDV